MQTTGYGACPADVDGDGDIDLVVARDLLAPAVYVNDGAADMRETIAFGVPGAARDCATGDFNADGIIDVAITDRGAGSFVVYGPLLGAQERQTVFTGNAVGVIAGDLNADGRDDLVFTLRGGATLAVLINDEATRFAAPVMLGTPDRQSRAAAIADLDDDGDMDIVAAVLTGANRVYYNQDGTFSDDGGPDRAQDIGPADEYSAAVDIGDFDGDGRADIVFGNDGKNSLVMRSADGWRRSEIEGDAADTYDIKAADITGDAYPDLIVANSGAPNMIYWNRPAREAD